MRAAYIMDRMPSGCEECVLVSCGIAHPDRLYCRGAYEMKIEREDGETRDRRCPLKEIDHEL